MKWFAFVWSSAKILALEAPGQELVSQGRLNSKWVHTARNAPLEAPGQEWVDFIRQSGRGLFLSVCVCGGEWVGGGAQSKKNASGGASAGSSASLRKVPKSRHLTLDAPGQEIAHVVRKRGQEAVRF